MTHKKIAELAHVSVSTVSKALSGSREVSEELTEKIKQIALDTGYFKEKSQKRHDYSKKKSSLIAVLCPEIISVHYSEVVTAIKDEVLKHGGQLAVYIYDFDIEKLNSIVEMIVFKNDADGIILISSDVPKIKANIPAVYFGSPDTSHPQTVTASCNNEGILFDAVKHLKSLGHREIGFIGEPLTTEKLKAFSDAMEQNSLTLNPEYVYTISKRFEEIGYDAVNHMLTQEKLPTALVAAYDEIALAAIHRLHDAGIKVPDDISIIGINDIPSAAYAQVPLTTFRFFHPYQCETVVNALYEMIFEESSERKHFPMEHELIIRSSTAPPRKNTGKL